MKKRILTGASVLAALVAAMLVLAGGSSANDTPALAPLAHHPLYMADAQNQGNPTLQPPPVCCVPPPESLTGKLPVPDMINMAYFGGHVQVTPKIYLVLWGWGQAGAFNHTVPGMPTSDPDGAGRRMVNFVKALGGTAWAGVQTQYYQTNADASQTYIKNPANQFGGVWNDNTNPIHNNVTGLELAQEAQRAAAHFGVTDLKNSQFVIAQPQMYNEAGFNSGAGYCAWHDYTQNQYYPGVQEGLSFTNMPYVLNSGSGCGEHSVNSGYYAGLLDGYSIVLGHEIEETVTDPGAEDVINGVNLGGWYDYQAFENGDKCAWAWYTFGIAPTSVLPGSLQNITGNDGKQYPIQTLWSNTSAGGVGYCAGGTNDLPETPLG